MSNVLRLILYFVQLSADREWTQGETVRHQKTSTTAPLWSGHQFAIRRRSEAADPTGIWPYKAVQVWRRHLKQSTVKARRGTSLERRAKTLRVLCQLVDTEKSKMMSSSWLSPHHTGKERQGHPRMTVSLGKIGSQPYVTKRCGMPD